MILRCPVHWVIVPKDINILTHWIGILLEILLLSLVPGGINVLLGDDALRHSLAREDDLTFLDGTTRKDPVTGNCASLDCKFLLTCLVPGDSLSNDLLEEATLSNGIKFQHKVG